MMTEEDNISNLEMEDVDKKSKSSSRPRLWRNLLVGTIAVMFIIGAAMISYIVTRDLSEPLEEPQAAPLLQYPRLQSLQGISFDEAVFQHFFPEDFNGTWVSDTEFLFKTSELALHLFNAEDQTSRELVSSEVMDKIRPVKYELSPSRKYLLLAHQKLKIYRESYLALYTIIDLQTNAIFPFVPPGSPGPVPLQLAQWSPTEDAIIFVSKNDLFYAPSVVDLTSVIRITDTGRRRVIFNGIPDWLYEEEIINSNSATWFSPNGRRIAFATFNDTLVDDMNFTLYNTHGVFDPQYPVTASLKYPKAGRTNPEVYIQVVDLPALAARNGRAYLRLTPPKSLPPKDLYFTSVAWADNDRVSVIWLNRQQNVSIISICSVLSGLCVDDLLHISPDNAWIDLFVPPIFDAEGKNYILILPLDQGDKGHFKHIHLRNIDEKTLVPLTRGTSVVTEILGWDTDNHVIYFIAAPSGNPSQRHIYWLGDQNHPSPGRVVCVTCNFKNDHLESCNYNEVDMSEEYSYFSLTCSGPGIPQVTLHRSADLSRIALLEDNDEVRTLLKGRSLPLLKRMQIDVAGGFKARVSMKLPPNFNPSLSYPMVVRVYGGPGSQEIDDKFSIDWGDYMASTRGVIYTHIDGRGSGYQGDKFLHTIDKGLGTVEVEDQLSVTE
ncbi:A-type potassium channel modulatory protein DPP6-like isoform X2 [Oratosquilla oratoria]